MSTTTTGTQRKAMTQAAFARHMGWAKSRITQLKQAGRLVLTDDGKRVLVEETKRLIEETKDPNRRDVAERWAAERGEQQTDSADVAVPGQPLTHAQAKATKEYYLAENARLDYEERCGKLLERDQVKLVVADAFTTLRTQVESWPALLAPQLAGQDEGRIQALLAEHVELSLTQLVERLGKIDR
jgi:hypothetical protein